MEIVILEKQSDKLIRMEVQPKHTIGSIIETIVDHEKLDKRQRYQLRVADRSFGKEQYLIKLKDVGISHGDHLFLEMEGRPPPHEYIEPPKPPKGEDRRRIPEGPKFCPQCGKPLRAGGRFCLECGAPTRRR